jgi:hypothetical protein
MYATWIKNDREARKFWEEVGRGGASRCKSKRSNEAWPADGENMSGPSTAVGVIE